MNNDGQCSQCRLDQAIEASGQPVLVVTSSGPEVFLTPPKKKLSGTYVASILVTGIESEEVSGALLAGFSESGLTGFKVGEVDSPAGDGVGDLLYIGFAPGDVDVEMFTDAVRGMLVKALDNLDLLARVTMDLYPVEAVRIASMIRKVIIPTTFVFDRVDDDVILEGPDEVVVVVIQ